MSEMQPLAEYKRIGFSLAVYPNRIETSQVTFMWLRKKEVIPVRNIANVERPLSGRVIIHTNDGKKHSLICGFDRDRIYEAIMQVL